MKNIILLIIIAGCSNNTVNLTKKENKDILSDIKKQNPENLKETAQKQEDAVSDTEEQNQETLEEAALRKEKEKLLFEAIYSHNNEEAIKLLNEGVSISIEDEFGRTPLLAAAASNPNISFVKFLIEKGSEFNDVDFRGMTPLMHALNLANIDLINLLLEKGADIHYKNPFGKNAFDYLFDAILGADKALKILLKSFGISNIDLALIKKLKKHQFFKKVITSKEIVKDLNINKLLGQSRKILPLLVKTLLNLAEEIKDDDSKFILYSDSTNNIFDLNFITEEKSLKEFINHFEGVDVNNIDPNYEYLRWILIKFDFEGYVNIDEVKKNFIIFYKEHIDKDKLPNFTMKVNPNFIKRMILKHYILNEDVEEANKKLATLINKIDIKSFANNFADN